MLGALIFGAASFWFGRHTADQSPPEQARTYLDVGRLSSAMEGVEAVRTPRLSGQQDRPAPWSEDAFRLLGDFDGSMRVEVSIYDASEADFWADHDIPTAYADSAPNWVDRDPAEVRDRLPGWSLPIPQTLAQSLEQVQGYCIAGWEAKGLSDCLVASYWMDTGCFYAASVTVDFPQAEDGTAHADLVGDLLSEVRSQLGCND